MKSTSNWKKNLFSSGISQKDLTPDQIKQMKQSIIKNIALNRALAIKGKEEKLDKDKKYTENQDVIKEQLLASLTLVNEVNGKVNVTDEEAKNIMMQTLLPSLFRKILQNYRS